MADKDFNRGKCSVQNYRTWSFLTEGDGELSLPRNMQSPANVPE